MDSKIHAINKIASQLKSAATGWEDVKQMFILFDWVVFKKIAENSLKIRETLVYVRRSRFDRWGLQQFSWTAVSFSIIFLICCSCSTGRYVSNLKNRKASETLITKRISVSC